MKNILLVIILTSVVAFGCVRASKKCKDNARKMKKNNIGWKY